MVPLQLVSRGARGALFSLAFLLVSLIATAAVKSPDVVAALRKQDFEAVGSTPEEALRQFQKEIRFYTEAKKVAGSPPF